MLPIAVARSSGGVVIGLLPVLLMTSYLLVSQDYAKVTPSQDYTLDVAAQLKRSAPAALGLAINCVQ